MAINLEKGQRVNVGLPKFVVGLGWDANSSSTGEGFDLDASVFILGENKKIISDSHFVFYNNLISPDSAVEHTGDNLTGAGDGDDESIKVDQPYLQWARKRTLLRRRHRPSWGKDGSSSRGRCRTGNLV